jgi:hypothetical protein
VTGSGARPISFAPESPENARFARIQAAIAHTPSSSVGTRARITTALCCALGLTVVAVLTASQLVYHRYAAGLEFQAASQSSMVTDLILLSALTVVVTVAATSRRHTGFGFPAGALLLTSVMVAPLYAILVAAGPAHTLAADAVDVAISTWGLRCLSLSAVTGLTVFASLALALRGSIAAGSAWRGAAIGATAGAWAGFAVFLFCPSDDLRHLLIAHVLPIVGFTVLGGTTITRLLRL